MYGKQRNLFLFFSLRLSYFTFSIFLMICHPLICYVTASLSFRFQYVQWKSLVVVKRMKIQLAEYYAIGSGLIFFFEKKFHKEYIVVFVCIRFEFSNTIFVSMCMRFHSERTAIRACPTLSYPISTFSLYAICRF